MPELSKQSLLNLENNSLKAEIEKLLQLSDEAEAANKGGYSFGAPIDEEEMTSWEQKTGITIPESYKEWLRFSGESEINGAHAFFGVLKTLSTT